MSCEYGTFPTTASKEASDTRHPSSPAPTMWDAGFNAWAMRAERGSHSTPVKESRAPSGAVPMKLPVPHPGSSTASVPEPVPMPCSARMAWIAPATGAGV